MTSTTIVVRIKGAPLFLPYGFKRNKVIKVMDHHRETMTPRVHEYLTNTYDKMLLSSTSIHEVKYTVNFSYEPNFKKSRGLIFTTSTCQVIATFITIRVEIQHDESNLFKLKDFATYDDLISDSGQGLYLELSFDVKCRLHDFGYDTEQFA